METSSQIDGYVYIARIIDHGGKFVNGYHKIGLSKQYKVRETQLNSTHLPFDVLMVRVFETTNMKQVEGLLHLCFEDYRVVKEYDYRKNITTEWFDFNDTDAFNYRIDKFIELMSMYGTKEIDISRSIDNDTTLTKEEKEEVKEIVRRAKGTNLKVEVDGIDISGDSAKGGFVNAFNKVIETVDPIQLSVDFNRIFKENREDYPDYKQNPCFEINGFYLDCQSSTKEKMRQLMEVFEKYNIFGKVDVI